MTWLNDFADNVLGKAPRRGWDKDNEDRLEAFRAKYDVKGELMVMRDQYGWWSEPSVGDRLWVTSDARKMRRVRVVRVDRDLCVMEVMP